MLSAMLLTSCAGGPAPKAEIFPELTFPDLPKADYMEQSEDGKSVTVDSDWIVRMAEFSLKYDALRQEYLGLRDIWDFSATSP